MATAVYVDASRPKKIRTANVKKPSSFDEDSDSDNNKVVTLTKEDRRQISYLNYRFRTSGGFDVPDISPHLLRKVPFSIEPRDLKSSRTRNFVLKVVNRAITHHNKNKKMMEMDKENDEVGDLTLVEVLRYCGEEGGAFLCYFTFKAKDSSGAIRTYETLMSPIFRGEENEDIEIFRVKPYTGVDYPGHGEVEKPVLCG